jgi:hypothetical protein
LILAVLLFAADVITPGTSFPGLGVVGEVLFWMLFLLSLLFIVLFVTFRGRSY